jgi:hypothetical protein
VARPKKSEENFMTEFAVNLISDRYLLTSASQLMSEGEMLSDELEASKNCHIYMVVTRPAVHFDPSDFTFAEGVISGSLVYRNDDGEQRHHFSSPFQLMDGAIRLELSPYPYNEIRTYDSEGRIVRLMPANAVSVYQTQLSYEHAFRKLKVLYVGQSYAGGHSSAFDRLRKHDTLQKILATTAYESPSNEILVLAVEYLPPRIISTMNGMDKSLIRDERDEKRFTKALDADFSKKLQISLVEAALIRYFQPKYNKVYKKKFPSRDLKVLQQCYQYDFSSLAVEFDTSELVTYSDVVAPNDHHIANFMLTDDSSRMQFFAMLSRPGDVDLTTRIAASK